MSRVLRRRRTAAVGAAALAVAGAAAVVASAGLTASPSSAQAIRPHLDRSTATASPIKHVVVIFDENISFDHYFGTYPKALNTDGTRFTAITSTPKADNLTNAGLLVSNPNLYAPRRLAPSQAMTCDQNHAYGPEQQAFNDGAMNMFVQKVSVDTCSGLYGQPGLTMDYYDGNTVTALWNYAQQFSLSDNSFGSTFGPSTPGALNLVSGQTHGFRAVTSTTLQPTTDAYAIASPDANGVGTVINDPDPAYDDCSDKNHTSTNNLAASTGGPNIGDLLNRRGVTWGWFQGGFTPTTPASATQPYAVCGATHTNVGGASVVDYSPHHNPFSYYASTSNPHHLPPSSVSAVGHTDQANHQYDLTTFDTALSQGVLPAVSFLKAPEYQDGHAGYSDPLDEQAFLVQQINAIQTSRFWKDTAVIVAYDDSDGWYDHVASPVRNASHDAANDAAICNDATAGVLLGQQDRCGPGTRQPLLVISPWSKTDHIDHRPTEQASIPKFIEDNWFLPRISGGSFDARAGRLDSMFDFTQSNGKRVILNADGSVKVIRPIPGLAIRATH